MVATAESPPPHIPLYVGIFVLRNQNHHSSLHTRPTLFNASSITESSIFTSILILRGSPDSDMIWILFSTNLHETSNIVWCSQFFCLLAKCLVIFTIMYNEDLFTYTYWEVNVTKFTYNVTHSSPTSYFLVIDRNYASTQLRARTIVGLQQRRMYRDVVHFIDNFSYK